MLRKSSLISVLLCLGSLAPSGHSQQVDPSWQIGWSTPITGQGPISQFYNGIPQADQFTGSDFCAKVKAAEVYAIAHSIQLVDATHFGNALSCSSDPFVSLASAGSTVNLTVMLPAAVISTTVNNSSLGLTVNNVGLNLVGQGRGQTIFQYTGTSSLNYVFGSENCNMNGCFNIFRDFSVLGNTHVTNAIYLQGWHRSTLENVSAWGATGCGIATAGAVTDTFIKPHVSSFDAALFGWNSLQTPANGLCFNSFGGNQTTDGTVTDAAAEGVTGIGWYIQSANSMHFSAGTSEGNGHGITVNPGSKWNTFTSPDIEQNTANVSGVDITDNGQTNFYTNAIASSTCSSCNSALAGGGGGQYILGEAGFLTSFTGSWAVLGVNSDIGALSGSGGLKAGYIASNRTSNAVGFQSLQVACCAITAGAIGNQCSNTFTFLSIGGVVEPDAQYKVVCSAQGGNGVWTIGNMTAINTTGFIIASVALTSSATGNGTVNCLVSHN